MSVIELRGHVNERGELEFEPPAHLPPGDVRITIEPIGPDELPYDDDPEWNASFAASLDVLQRLADKAHAEYMAGQTEDFDPDNDPDAGDL